MAIDDRKRRILMEIVSLYSTAGEPVGSGLLSRHFDMAVSSATLRNEMAALTRLGLLEQPHTSAGRVPTAAGYRYYVDNLMNGRYQLSVAEKRQLDSLFHELDSDPEKLAQGAAKTLADYLNLAVITTTPRAEDVCVAHYELIQVGRYSAAVLAVTGAGGVRTRVAKVDFELNETDILQVKTALNRYLRFVTQADVNQPLLRSMMESLGNHGAYYPILDAALKLLGEMGDPSVYFEGHQYLLHWPELEPSLRSILTLMSDNTRLEALIRPQGALTTVLLGEELEQPIRGLSIVSCRYLAGGGLTGVIAVAGPTRMPFEEVIPRLEYFSNLLGRGMAGA